LPELHPETDVQEVGSSIIIQVFRREQIQVFICEIKTVLLISPALDAGVIEDICNAQINVDEILVFDPDRFPDGCIQGKPALQLLFLGNSCN